MRRTFFLLKILQSEQKLLECVHWGPNNDQIKNLENPPAIVWLKMLGASAFYPIKYSILKLYSQKLACMSLFDIQKYIFKKFEKFPKMAEF